MVISEHAGFFLELDTVVFNNRTYVEKAGMPVLQRKGGSQDKTDGSDTGNDEG